MAQGDPSLKQPLVGTMSRPQETYRLDKLCLQRLAYAMTVTGHLKFACLVCLDYATNPENTPEKPNSSLFPLGHIRLLGQESVFFKDGRDCALSLRLVGRGRREEAIKDREETIVTN